MGQSKLGREWWTYYIYMWSNQ